MDINRSRLAWCFKAIFPDLDEEQLHNATPFSVRTWDSIATVNLLALIEEEFGVQVLLGEPSTVSFEGILDALRKEREAVL